MQEEISNVNKIIGNKELSVLCSEYFFLSKLKQKFLFEFQF
jgi:hypothetical protein